METKCGLRSGARWALFWRIPLSTPRSKPNYLAVRVSGPKLEDVGPLHAIPILWSSVGRGIILWVGLDHISGSCSSTPGPRLSPSGSVFAAYDRRIDTAGHSGENLGGRFFCGAGFQPANTLSRATDGRLKTYPTVYSQGLLRRISTWRRMKPSPFFARSISLSNIRRQIRVAAASSGSAIPKASITIQPL